MTIKIARLSYCNTLCFRAEAATKAKLEKVAEIKRLNSQVMAIKRYRKEI